MKGSIHVTDIPSMDENEFMVKYTPFIHYVLNRMNLNAIQDKTGFSKEDLVSFGAMFLLKAKRGFDPSKGFQFSTYAFPYVYGGVMKEVNRNWKLYIPRPVKELRSKINKLRAEGMSDEEIIEVTGATEKQFEKARYADSLTIVSSDEALSTESEDYTLHSVLRDDLDLERETENKFIIEDFLSTLTYQEGEVWRKVEVQGMTQKQVADILGISQAHVSRILSRVFVKARKYGEKMEESYAKS